MRVPVAANLLVEVGIDVAVALLGPDVGIFLDFDLGVDDVDVLGAVTLFGTDIGTLFEFDHDSLRSRSAPCMRKLSAYTNILRAL